MQKELQVTGGQGCTECMPNSCPLESEEEGQGHPTFCVSSNTSYILALAKVKADTGSAW